jgi:hypothetical protein
MARALVDAAGFAIAGGAAADSADLVFVAGAPDRSGRLLLAACEPLDASPRGRELAGVALRVMRETFATTPGSGTDALLAAFAAANAALLNENRALTTGASPRRLCVGATGIAIAGREITVAQSPPSQAVLVQDGQVYAFPEVGSWRGDYQPDEPLPPANPLGFAEDQLPLIYVSEAAPGDLIALCATSVGRTIGRDEDAAVALYGGSLLTADLEGSVDRLERLLAEESVPDGFAVVATIVRLGARRRAMPSLPKPRARSRAGVPPPPDANRQPAVAGFGANPVPVVSAAKAPRPRFEALRDWAADLAEIAAAQRRAQTVDSEARRRALAAPGALSVQRYRESGGLPAEWRANLPRGPGVHMPSRLLAVTIVLFLALSGTGLAVGHQRDRAARAEAALAAVDVAMRDATENSGMAMSAIAEAEAALASAVAAGANGDALLRRQQELFRVRDQVWGVRRLSDVERVGALPGGAAEGMVRLALSGRTLYLAAGDLFEFDGESGGLVLLLARGDSVAGAAVGDLRHVSVDGGQVAVSDGDALYVRDDRGDWQRQPLAVAEVGGLRPETPIVVWGEAAYALAVNGDIVRLEQSATGPVASVWAAAEEHPDLLEARDFLIDGRIHVLLADGRTLTFSRGAHVGTSTPFVVPLLTDVAGLAEAPFANAFYIVDRNGRVGENSGRIVRVDAAGDTLQFLAPSPAAGDPRADLVARSLAGAQSLAIDDLAGTVYWIADGDLWRARLPAV